MTAPIVINTRAQRVAVAIRHVGTRGGEPLLAIGGGLFVLSHTSGWCIDGLHRDACKWARCRCACHEVAT